MIDLQTEIKKIEDAHQDIQIEHISSSKFDDDEYERYTGTCNGTEIFKILGSKINFKSGRVDIDYTLFTDTNSVQTPNLEKFIEDINKHISTLKNNMN